MAFKMITDSEKAAGWVAGTAQAHADMVTEQQVTKWQGWLDEGDNDVGIGQMQRFYAVKLRRLCRTMVEKEQQHMDQLTLVKLLRDGRDEAASQVRTRLGNISKLVEGKFGEDAVQTVVEEKPSVLLDPVTLSRVGSRVVLTMLNPELKLKLPEPLVTLGADLDFSTLALEVVRPVVSLASRLRELDHERAILAGTLAEKIEAHKAVDQLTKRLTRFLEGLYELEGNHEVAKALKSALKKAKKARAAVESEGGAEADGPEGDVPGGDAPEGDVPHGQTSAGRVEDGRRLKLVDRLAPRENPGEVFEAAARQAPAVAESAPLAGPRAATSRSLSVSGTAAKNETGTAMQGGATVPGEAPAPGAAGEGTGPPGGRARGR